jgi:hypothetical protein
LKLKRAVRDGRPFLFLNLSLNSLPFVGMATLQILEAQGVSATELVELNLQLAEMVGWLKIRAPNAKWSIGFAFELTAHSYRRGYNVDAILDEIGILEGTLQRRSITKPAKEFGRCPLQGLWHKHHNQACFLWKNISLELDRPGELEAICKPYIGKYMGEVSKQLVDDLVFGSYRKRASRAKMTGEFIVFEKLEDGRNYYLTLGCHGEYDAIASRVTDYKQVDFQKGNL